MQVVTMEFGLWVFLLFCVSLYPYSLHSQCSFWSVSVLYNRPCIFKGAVFPYRDESTAVKMEFTVLYAHIPSLQGWALLWESSSAQLVPVLEHTGGGVSRTGHINSCRFFVAFGLLTASCWPVHTACELLTKQVWLVYAIIWKQIAAYL